ncbi:MAG: DUF3821 domain-containing protein [Methanoregula sp.]|nr:DUF3821 domain-containing protein [Methanoregula sp.]
MTKRLTIALVALAVFVLVAALPVSAMSYNIVNTSINKGATVFIGETGLNLSSAVNAFAADHITAIGWWASAAQITNSAPTATYPLTNPSIVNSTTISYAAFGSYYGPWYAMDAAGTAYPEDGAFFNVKDPQLSLDIWDYSQNTAQGGTSMSGKSVIQGDYLGFKIGTDMDTAVNQPTLRGLDTARSADTGYKTGGQWANIRVKTDQGNILTGLYGATGGTVNTLLSQVINAPAWYWGSTGTLTTDWFTSALDSTGQNAYPAGTYTCYVESALNGMYDNYQLSGAAYTGKTVSAAQTVTLVSNTVKITANKDTVVRSKPFSVTITGRPNTNYHVWIKGTSMMSGAWDNQPPMFAPNQVGVTNDSYITSANVPAVQNLVTYSAVVPAAANSIGGYLFQNSGTTFTDPSTTDMTGTMYADVAHGDKFTPASGSGQNGYENMVKLGNGTYLYANVSLNDGGTRTVELTTSNWTKAQKYTVRVEQNFAGTYKSDEVDVKVEKGAVTIVAAGDQSYYLGEEIKFSGTNTETQNTYLMITGPNLKPEGSQIASMNPRANAVSISDLTTWTMASVLGDNTWSYKWGTSNVALDAGTYTIWALSGPALANDYTELNTVSYGTVSIVVKKPFISATAAQSTVAQGDKLLITGIAEGSPSAGVQIWVLGKNFADLATKAVNSDATFSYEVTRATTSTLAPGQYFVVAQHPMQNNQFDVYKSGDYVYNRQLVATTTTGNLGTKVFTLLGAGSLQGSDAAEALVQAINDPNVDDTYTKLQFLVENPTITVTPVGDRHVGDKFTIAATTNLAVDDEVLCQVYSSSFKPTQKSQSGEFSGTSGTVKVTKGTTGLNAISFPVDASTFKPDEYIVQEDGVLVSATGTALFNILEGAAPTAVPTVVVTTAAPVTTVATTVAPTTVAPTKTPTQPGFGALVALVGLGAVALLVVRRH